MLDAALPREGGRFEPARGLLAFIWLLPFHVAVVAFLFGALRWPASTVRLIAAWKEALVLALFVLTLWRALWRGGAGREVRWLDIAVGGLGALAFTYLLGAGVWFDAALPGVAQLYGLRDVALLSLLYFVGRATPGVADDERYLRGVFIVGVATSVVAILERLFVTPEMLVLLGASRYVQEFLGAGLITHGNEYGLAGNYWTQIGSQIVRRAGSTYLSSQAFAIPFLVVLPAATVWLLARPRRFVPWLGYGLLWVGLLLSITRMTIVACLLETALLVLARRQWRLAVGLGVASLAAAAAALVLAPGLGTYLWQTLTWQTGSSISHLSDWSLAVQNLVRHPLGMGLGSTDFVAARFGVTPMAADNQYFKYAVELGPLGLGLHVAVLAGIGAAGVRAFRHAASERRRMFGLLVAVAALGVALNETTAGVFNAPFLAYVFFWMAGTAVTIGQREPEPRALPGRPEA